MTATQQLSQSEWSLQTLEQPTGEAGGDLVIQHEDGDRLRILLGDVTGHGPVAAAAAEQVREQIALDFAGALTPAHLRAWSRIVHHLLPGRFVAITYLEINFVTGKAVVANGGNPPLLIHRGKDGDVEQSVSTGMPLGIVDDEDWQAPQIESFTFEPGDSLICFTDGLTDIVGLHRNQRFGLSRVVSSVTAADGSPVESIGTSIDSFSDPSAEQDDVTVLWIGYTGRCAA